ncbi:MAG: hypothetical protein WAQ28_18435 [Bacteroidia bacterium]|jgi:hypothetical protein
MENNKPKKDEYAILGQCQRSLTQEHFFEITPDNSTIVVLSNGLHFLDQNFNLLKSIDKNYLANPTLIAISPSQKNIALPFEYYDWRTEKKKTDVFVFDIQLLNENAIGNRQRNQISSYDSTEDITCMKFISGNILLTGYSKGSLFITDIQQIKILHKKNFHSKIKNIEYSTQSGLLVICLEKSVTVFSVNDNWKELIKYSEYNDDTYPDEDKTRHLRAAKFNENGNLLAVSFSAYKSLIGHSEITILDCLNNFGVYKKIIPDGKKIIQEFYPNEDFEFRSKENPANIDFLNFTNDTNLLYGVRFKIENHKKLNYGEPEELKNYLFVVEMNLSNNLSKIIFSQRDHALTDTNDDRTKLVGTNPFFFNCNSRLVKIGFAEKNEDVISESLASVLESQYNSDKIKRYLNEQRFSGYKQEFDELKRKIVDKDKIEFVSKSGKALVAILENHLIIIQKSNSSIVSYIFDYKKIKSVVIATGFIPSIFNSKISFYHDGNTNDNLVELRINQTDAEYIFNYIKSKTA